MEKSNSNKKAKGKLKEYWQKNKIIVWYSILFGMIALFMIGIFEKYGKSFIWEKADGLTQHVVNLQNFRQVLIDFIKTGKLSTFTWNIGSGFDLFSNLAYYNFGDIFAYVSILFPKNKMELLYNLLVIVRMYFCGITFICYCKYRKMKSFPSIMGALMYTFCTFVLFSAVRHPYFVNAVIIFPLVMMGIEKMIVEDKKLFYTIIIAATFIMNFYFAYMIAMIIAIYGIILASYTYKKEGIQKIVKVLLKVFFYSILGIMISAIVLLPAAIAFLNSERTGTNTVYPYTLGYYRNLFGRLLNENGTGYWVCFGVQSISLIALPIFAKNRKENYPLFWLMVILLIPLLVSQIASMLCGFGYPNNRWIFVLVFIFSFATTKLLHNDKELSKLDLIYIATFVLTYLGWNIVSDIQLKFYTQVQLGILVAFLLLMLNRERLKSKFKKAPLYEIGLTIIMILGIISSMKYLYSVEGSNYASEFLDKNSLNNVVETSKKTINGFGKAVKHLNKQDKGFYKISKNPHDFDNLPLMLNYKGIGSFYSITPKVYSDLNKDLSNIQYEVSYGMKEFDYRTKINTLLGVKYYITNGKETIVPYGYSLDSNYKGNATIYKNNYDLPFGVLYTSYISIDEYNALNPIEKENSLLKVSAIEDDKIQESEKLQKEKTNYEIQEIAYQMNDENHIITSNGICVKEEKQNEIKLNIGTIKNKEVYIQIEGLEYEPFSKEQIINKAINAKTSKIEEAKVKHKYKWYQPDYSYNISVKMGKVSKSKTVENYLTSPYYSNMPEMVFNLGYFNEISGDISLKFSKKGNYRYKTIKIYTVSMENYERDIENLRKSNFEVLDYGNNYLNGKVDAEKSGILQFATMYDKGWKVYVDGKEAETLKSNKYFLGIDIEKGKHTINLIYNNPYIIYGLVTSIVGVSIFVMTIVYYRKKKV